MLGSAFFFAHPDFGKNLHVNPGPDQHPWTWSTSASKIAVLGIFQIFF
jgi:hypothetical protein